VPTEQEMPPQYDQGFHQRLLQLTSRGSGLPASVQEYQYYTGLPEPQQQQFMGLKRADKTLNLGDRSVVIGPGGEKTYQRGVPEEKTPAYREQVKESESRGTSGGINLTPAEKKVDEVFAKDYSEYVASGGFADVNKLIGQLGGVLTQLKKATGEVPLEKGESKPNLTGPGLGAMPNWALSRTHPKAVAARDAVEEVVQRNLRLVLGAQFTEKEGERLIARAYNPSLDEKENIKRVTRLIGQIKAAAKAKQRASNYYERYGTLKGFKGKLWTITDFDGGEDLGQSLQEGVTQAPQAAIDALMQNNTPEMQNFFKQKYGYLP